LKGRSTSATFPHSAALDAKSIINKRGHHLWREREREEREKREIVREEKERERREREREKSGLPEMCKL
jgi:hypothetical protein